MKKAGVLFAVHMLCAVFFAGNLLAEDNFMAIDANEKVYTEVYIPSKNKALTMEEAIELAMIDASTYPDGEYFAKIYRKKELAKSRDFQDAYIYGAAINAVVSMNYGMVTVEYSRSDDEPESLAGWDLLSFYALDDGRVLCVKCLDE